MFCFISRWFPPLRGFFQIGTPLSRSMAQSERSFPSATFRKMRLSQTMAVEPDQAGRARRQAMFSVFDHVTGRLISRLRPFADGPRHAGQFSARRLSRRKSQDEP
jgi:hypothetical protein